jgi:D-3-phosphoglycerate dehydrogenase
MVVTDHKFRVLLADKLAPEGVRVLDEAEGVEVDDRAGLEPEELKSAIPGYDALIVRSRTRVTAEILEAGNRLRVVGRAGVGLDNIDLDCARQRGIQVLNAPGGNVISAAEHTVALMLALVRHIAQADASVRRGEWERSRFKGVELQSKTVGLIGAGRIGSEVAKRVQAFGVRVIAFDPYLAPERAEREGMELVTLPELLRRADLVSIHTPLTDETRRLIGEPELATMKSDAYLINAARGGVVDEYALAGALKDGKLAGAALDVFENEPIPSDHPLLKLPNVLLVPHLGAATREAQASSGVEICRAVRDALIASENRPAAGVS